jgi:hypothetical protein
MNTTVIVAIGIWNGLLLTSLIVVIARRNQVLEWITGIDRWNRNQWAAGDDVNDAWTAFLSGHPELHELELRPRETQGS